MKKLILSFTTLIIFAGIVSAQTRTPGINKTQRNQQVKIHQGIKSGELTRPEVWQLERQQARIQCEKRIAKADGVVTNGERVRIHKHQAFASRNIYCKKHNYRDRS
ncbi:MAG: hypothetical protein AB1521_17800 [Bacteroidota bacterium]